MVRTLVHKSCNSLGEFLRFNHCLRVRNTGNSKRGNGWPRVESHIDAYGGVQIFSGCSGFETADLVTSLKKLASLVRLKAEVLDQSAEIAVRF